jgi:hypothetical protein
VLGEEHTASRRKFKNEQDSEGVKTLKPYDKDVKRPSKSRDTVPLNTSNCKTTKFRHVYKLTLYSISVI